MSITIYQTITLIIHGSYLPLLPTDFVSRFLQTAISHTHPSTCPKTLLEPLSYHSANQQLQDVLGLIMHIHMEVFNCPQIAKCLPQKAHPRACSWSKVLHTIMYWHTVPWGSMQQVGGLKPTSPFSYHTENPPFIQEHTWIKNCFTADIPASTKSPPSIRDWDQILVHFGEQTH